MVGAHQKSPGKFLGISKIISFFAVSCFESSVIFYYKPPSFSNE